jgi:hypothetical protein
MNHIFVLASLIIDMLRFRLPEIQHRVKGLNSVPFPSTLSQLAIYAFDRRRRKRYLRAVADHWSQGTAAKKCRIL